MFYLFVKGFFPKSGECSQRAEENDVDGIDICDLAVLQSSSHAAERLQSVFRAFAPHEADGWQGSLVLVS